MIIYIIIIGGFTLIYHTLSYPLRSLSSSLLTYTSLYNVFIWKEFLLIIHYHFSSFFHLPSMCYIVKYNKGSADVVFSLTLWCARTRHLFLCSHPLPSLHHVIFMLVQLSSVVVRYSLTHTRCVSLMFLHIFIGVGGGEFG